MAILFGLGVFAVIAAVGWRSVQNRSILRLRGADGQETIIFAGEDDEISSIVSTTETTQTAPAPAPAVVIVNTGVTDQTEDSEFINATQNEAMNVEADAAGRDRLSRLVSSNK